MGQKNVRSTSEHFVVGRLCRFCTPGNVMLDTAVALAMAREHAKDVGPELLEWKYCGNENYREQVLTFVTAAIVVHAARTGIEFHSEGFAYAALDAAYRVQFGPRRGGKLVTAAKRAKQVKMRYEDFLEIRSEGEERLERRIYKSLRNMMSVFNIEAENAGDNVVKLRPKDGFDRYSSNAPRVRGTNREVGAPRAA
jgi:hypothetical protein